MEVTLKLIVLLSVIVILKKVRRLSLGESEICSSSVTLVYDVIN